MKTASKSSLACGWRSSWVACFVFFRHHYIRNSWTIINQSRTLESLYIDTAHLEQIAYFFIPLACFIFFPHDCSSCSSLFIDRSTHRIITLSLCVCVDVLYHVYDLSFTFAMHLSSLVPSSHINHVFSNVLRYYHYN